MRNVFFDRKTLCLYLMILSLFLTVPLVGNKTVTVISENAQIKNHVVIDAGHGGVDGGAVSCTGVLESKINLEIALKLEAMLHLFGIRTVMIRNTDRSVYTQGTTIAAKKVSDIRERVRIVNSTQNALLLSIHQNHYTDPRYSGGQVFYNHTADSKKLGEMMQAALHTNLDSSNKRPAKKISGVYLMEHINCTGILVECGFLSNPQEEAFLRDASYQKKLCGVIAATVSGYLNT